MQVSSFDAKFSDNMDIDERNIDEYTLEDLDNEATNLQNELKQRREELDETMKQLIFMKKKQKVIEIGKTVKQLTAVKEELAENRQQIKVIDDNIKIMRDNGNCHTFLICLY